ncbi:hypothetical protein PMAYCL1PPCAC_01231 [Pristionchus mayeri]|uniref:Uncharacterized protein n=1 Tax=Pristionchus mayeri TaxID=1317129 RepID=A0AAN4YZC9_9BILA|nr:hypothetical protein PMAYCL1PPCAC_01231 [Pristionchus mayeri]
MCRNRSGPKWMPPYHLVTTTINPLAFIDRRICIILGEAPCSPSSSQSSIWNICPSFSVLTRYAYMLCVARAILLFRFSSVSTRWTSSLELTLAMCACKVLFLSRKISPVWMGGHSSVDRSTTVSSGAAVRDPPSIDSGGDCKEESAGSCSISWRNSVTTPIQTKRIGHPIFSRYDSSSWELSRFLCPMSSCGQLSVYLGGLLQEFAIYDFKLWHLFRKLFNISR